MAENSGISGELVNWFVFSKEHSGVTHTKVVNFQVCLAFFLHSHQIIRIKSEMF